MKTENPLKKYIFFGLDEFEFTISKLSDDFFYYKKLVWDIDTDNTPYGYIELFDLVFTYTKIRVSGYDSGLMFSTSIDGISIPCFSLLKGKLNNNSAKSKDKVVLYSSFFVLQYIGKLSFTLSEFIGHCFNYEKAKLYRLDIALDIPLTISQLQSSIFSDTDFYSQIGKDIKHPEFSQTYYIKNPQQSQNRNYIIRVYDKVLDTWKKNKSFLYPHLHTNPDVRRIELELRPEQAKYYGQYSLFDFLENNNQLISKIFVKYLNRNINEKYHLDYGILNLLIFKTRQFDLKQAYLDYGHVPQNYITHGYGYLNRIIKNTGYNGLLQLIFSQKHDDVFLQKHIRIVVNKILNNEEHFLHLYEKENITSNIVYGYEFLDHLILYLKKNGLRSKRINRVLRRHLDFKIKLGKKD